MNRTECQPTRATNLMVDAKTLSRTVGVSVPTLCLARRDGPYRLLCTGNARLAASRMDEQGHSMPVSDCVRPVVGLGMAYCRIGERHVYISRTRTRDVRISVPKGTRWYNLLRGALRKQQAQKSPYYGAFRDFRVLMRGQETIRWCGRRDSNSHTLRRQNLNLVCLPIPPRPQTSNENARQCLAFRNMGWTMGFEPTTAGATILCSTN